MYILGVRAKNENGEIIRKEINYEIKDELSITNFSIDCMSPQEIKKTINISADSIGGTGKILYKFYIKDKNETKILQDFNENKTVKWVPDTPGNYKIIVEVKDSTGNIVKNEKSDFVINDKLKINTFDTIILMDKSRKKGIAYRQCKWWKWKIYYISFYIKKITHIS